MNYPDLRDWLVAFVAETLEIAPAEVDQNATWDDLGIDSASIMVLVDNLAAADGRAVKPIEVLDHPTVTALAEHLTRQAA